MKNEKISDALSEILLSSQPEEWMDLIVELVNDPGAEAPGASQQGKIAARKAAFAKSSEAATALIHHIGGEVTRKAWINSTLRARVQKKMVSALSDEEPISKLNTPHMLKSDSNRSGSD